MRDDLGSDLDEILPQRRHRPLPDALGQGQPKQDVAHVARQGEQLQAGLIIHEVVTRQARQLDSVLALLESLLGRAAPVVELHHAGVRSKSTRRASLRHSPVEFSGLPCPDVEKTLNL